MKKFKFILLLILLGIIVLYSIGSTLQYYFFTDDYVFLYYLRNNLNFGWPYSSVLSIFRPIYQIFGINPLPYFTLAVVSYFFAGVSIFFFTKILTKNDLVAVLASLVFATGYIGLDQFSMIAVSIINNLNVINVCITLILLIKFIESKKYRYYFLTFFMFWFSLLLFPYRAYPLVLLLPTIEIIRTFKLERPSYLFKQNALLVLRYIPFFIVGVMRGIFSYGTHGTENVDKLNLLNTHSKIYTLFYIDFFKELFAVLGKFILVKPVSDLFNFTPSQNFYSLTGFVVFMIAVTVSIKFILEKKSINGKNLLILSLLVIESYVGNMFLNVDFDANGAVNRYLTISFAFHAPFLIFLLYLIFEKFERVKFIKKRSLLILVSILIIICFSSLSRQYTASAVEERSKPSQKFFRELKTYVPTLSDSNYNVFYFDRASYSPVSSRFDHVLLSAAMGNSVNLALPYNVSVNSIKIVDNYEDFLRMILYPPKGRNVTYYSFYNDENGLHDTTSEVFELLKNGKVSIIPLDQIEHGDNIKAPAAQINLNNISSLSPIILVLDLIAAPLDPMGFEFPYKSTEGIAEEVPSKLEKNNIFEYLISKEDYYKFAKVDAESIHVSKKNPASFLIDDDPETYWISDQSRWEVNIKPWINIDLSRMKNINKIILKQIPNRTIDAYSLSISLDGTTWTEIKNSQMTTPYIDKNLAVIGFPEIEARFVKLTINSLSVGPGPGLAEIEIIESIYSDINQEKADRVKKTPFELIRDAEELAMTYSYLSNSAELKIDVFTNKDDPTLESATVLGLPVFLDGVSHGYEIPISQEGTRLEKISIKGNFPANLQIQRISIENQSMEIITSQINEKCQEFAGVPTWKNPFDCQQVWEYNKPL